VFRAVATVCVAGVSIFSAVVLAQTRGRMAVSGDRWPCQPTGSPDLRRLSESSGALTP
jgi:hypothetical protein